MSTDQAVTETVSDLDDIVFGTETLDAGESIVGMVEASTEETVKAAFGALAGKTAEVATAEEPVDPSVEIAAEEPLETPIEETLEAVVEPMAEESIEAPVEDTPAEPAETAVEDTAELAAEAEESAEEEAPKTAGLLGLLKSPIGMGGIAVLVLAIGAGGFFFLSSGGDPKADEALEVAEAEHGESAAKSDYGDKDDTYAANAGKAWDNTFENEYGTLTFSGADAIYHTAPATVSLDVGADARRLRVSVGILTDKETAKALYTDGLKVSLLQIEAVESVDFGPYREWEMPGLIVSAFKTKLEDAYPDTKIRAVIIRDFQRVGA
ncbi:MAG: hypothetical protein HRT80_05305 [Henriciella sp.]|nr:hypothetical protein [Henriciella sp.]